MCINQPMSVASDDILQWVAQPLLTVGVVKYGRDYFMIGRPKRNVPSPYADPEMKASREKVLAAMRAAGITPRSDLVKPADGACGFLVWPASAKPPSAIPR